MVEPTFEQLKGIIDRVNKDMKSYDREYVHHESFIRDHLMYFDDLGFGVRMVSPRGILYSSNQFVEADSKITHLSVGKGENLATLLVQVPENGKSELENLKPLIEKFSAEWDTYKRDFDRMKAYDRERKDFEKRNTLKPQCVSEDYSTPKAHLEVDQKEVKRMREVIGKNKPMIHYSDKTECLE